MNNCLLLSGNANPAMARRIAACFGKELRALKIFRFSDGEISVKIEENIRGKDVFIIQPTCPPVNENLMELLVILDACRRASPRRITAVVPYYGYARQDRKDQPRVPITAKLVANLLVSAGANRLLTMDLHAPQIQGFFDIPVDHLFAAPVMIRYLVDKGLEDPVVVAPDVGGVKMARAFAKHLSGSLAIVDKRRDSPDKTEVMHIIGEVAGRDVVIVDDLISTGGTMIQAAETLVRAGAKSVYASATHAVFSGGAAEKIAASCISELLVTDTIPQQIPAGKITLLSVADLLGEAIKRIHLETSVSSLFV